MRGTIRRTWLVTILLAGSCVVSAAAAPEPRKLNNFVTELLHVEGEAAARESVLTFVNPREGWVFFRSSAHAKGRSGPFVALASQRIPPVLWHRPGNPETLEAMRYLPEGEHTLIVQSPANAPIESLTVRAIPEIIFDVYGGQPHFPGYGPYDLDFLRRIGLLDTCNVLATVVPYADDFLLEWTAVHGKRILACVSASARKQVVTAESAYQLWADGDRKIALAAGILVDDFRMDGYMEQHGAAWKAAFKRFGQERPDRLLYIYLGTWYPYEGTNGKRLEPFVGELLSTHARFAYEFYLFERETEAEARADIERRFIENMRGFHTYAPEFQKRLIFTLGFLCGAPETLDRNPTVNYKTYLDMQLHKIATHPLLDGTYGVEVYRSTYCDDEYLRWGVKLFRHYCIEGNTSRLSSDPYKLDHLDNPDFVNGLDGWTISPAGPETLAQKVLKGHGRCQGRYPALTGPDVDSLLWTKRQADKPNTISQDIRNLEPGRAYSLKMFIGDYGEMTDPEKNRNAKPTVQAVSVGIDNVEVLPEHGFNDAVRSYYGIDDAGKMRACFNVRRIVFRPKAESARLEISDWASKEESGGPTGQELTISFVEVEPFLMPND